MMCSLLPQQFDFSNGAHYIHSHYAENGSQVKQINRPLRLLARACHASAMHNKRITCTCGTVEPPNKGHLERAFCPLFGDCPYLAGLPHNLIFDFKI